MKVTVEQAEPVEPPKEVVVRLTEDEAKKLLRLTANYNYYKLYDALWIAGVR